MGISDWLATVGVSFLLIAFLLNLFNKINSESLWYGILNIIGAGLCAVSAYLISFYPFVVLETVWVVVTLVALIRNVPRGTR